MMKKKNFKISVAIMLRAEINWRTRWQSYNNDNYDEFTPL